jgi:threonine dehydratase
VDELKVQLPGKPSTIVLSVGGGGLLLGVMKGLERVGELMKYSLLQLIFSQTSYNNRDNHHYKKYILD